VVQVRIVHFSLWLAMCDEGEEEREYAWVESGRYNQPEMKSRRGQTENALFSPIESEGHTA
jgi:hypothetical protein